MTDRTVLKVSGTDRESFLQGLVSNDVKGLKDGMVYAALLTPQGKYLADFLLVPAEDAILIDVATDLARSLAQRLSMYKLRADVSIEATNIVPARGLGETPEAPSLTPAMRRWGGVPMTGATVTRAPTGTPFAWRTASRKAEWN